MNKPKTVSLPTKLLRQVDELRRQRHDPTTSDTVRVLLLQALAAMNYLRPSEMKALGIRSSAVGTHG